MPGLGGGVEPRRTLEKATTVSVPGRWTGSIRETSRRVNADTTRQEEKSDGAAGGERAGVPRPGERAAMKGTSAKTKRDSAAATPNVACSRGHASGPPWNIAHCSHPSFKGPKGKREPSATTPGWAVRR
jgi:hypothetical protein